MGDKENYHQLLAQLLQDEASHPSPPREFWQEMVSRFGEQVFSDILYHLTHMHFDRDTAKFHWDHIQHHRRELEKVNGRDLGLLVALADYFINIVPKVKNPMIVEINLFQRKEELALKDELTGLYNRRFFNRTLQQELDRARRFRKTMSLLMIDIDLFKRFNDRYGHPAGDAALKEIAGIMEKNCRSIDHLTRYGGEEFAVILPQSDAWQAFRTADRIRSAVEAHRFSPDPDLNLTVSIGAATFPIDAGDGLTLLECADQALYVAKRDGRNRVHSHHRERRCYPRYPFEIPVVMKDLCGQSVISGTTADISQGGLLSLTRSTVREGSEMDCRLKVGNHGADLSVPGRCIRVIKAMDRETSFYLGLQFKEALESLDPVRYFIEERSGSAHC